MQFIQSTAIKESADGLNYEEIKIGETPIPLINTGKSLYQQIQENNEKIENSEKEKHRNLPPKGLDEDELQFIKDYENNNNNLFKDSVKSRLEDKNTFEAAVAARVIKLAEDIKPIETIDSEINNDEKNKLSISSSLKLKPANIKIKRKVDEIKNSDNIIPIKNKESKTEIKSGLSLLSAYSDDDE